MLAWQDSAQWYLFQRKGRLALRPGLFRTSVYSLVCMPLPGHTRFTSATLGTWTAGAEGSATTQEHLQHRDGGQIFAVPTARHLNTNAFKASRPFASQPKIRWHSGFGRARRSSPPVYFAGATPSTYDHSQEPFSSSFHVFWH